jgi:hypothetical protein
MRYDFLVESYETERIKVLSVWSDFRDADLPVRPNQNDPRGRSVHEQMVHQCVSEDAWFRNMLGIDVAAPPVPRPEARIEFIRQYAHDSGKRLDVPRRAEERWWEERTRFFDVERTRARPNDLCLFQPSGAARRRVPRGREDAVAWRRGEGGDGTTGLESATR